MPRPGTSTSKRTIHSKFTDKETKMLIGFVKENQALWDPKHPWYVERDKTPIWNHIAAALNKSASDCKIQWNNMRNNFRTKWNLVQYNPSAANKHKKWLWWKYIEFLGNVFTMAKAEEEEQLDNDAAYNSLPNSTELFDDELSEQTEVNTSRIPSVGASSDGRDSDSPEPGYSTANKTSFSCQKKRKRSGSLDQHLLANSDPPKKVEKELNASMHKLVQTLTSNTAARSISDDEVFGKWVTATLEIAKPEHKPRLKKAVQGAIAKLWLEILEES